MAGFVFLQTSCDSKETTTTTTGVAGDTIRDGAIVLDDQRVVADNGVKTLQLQSRSNSQVSGTAELRESEGTVYLTINATGFPGAGEYALHIHEFGDCSAEDASSAGGHWNPDDDAHGKWGHGEFHKGDIGNLTATADGNVTYEFNTDKWCLGCGDTSKDIVGKSIVIHKDADDFTSQPAGNAGDRIACVVIQ